ncbi:MAG: DMT family transporter [Acidimicrobiia bacterium]
MLAVLLALGAALAYAAASVLQQREAQADEGPEGSSDRGGGIRLVLRLARKPVWLAGLACDGLGYGFQAVALGVGELLVVQPVITSGILFALPASTWWAGRKLGRKEFAWACVLALGLTVFLVFAGTDGGKDRASSEAWLVCAAIAVPVLGACVAAATRATGTRRAVLFAFATGALFGLTAALTKSSVVLLHAHGFGALGYWEPYALAILGALGFVLNQRAFQAGSLTASLPTLTVVEPVVAAFVGITMLDESIPTHGLPDWIAVVASVAAMVAATVVLSRSAARHDAIHEHELADTLTRGERRD